jgi:hypothetical protein
LFDDWHIPNVLAEDDQLALSSFEFARGASADRTKDGGYKSLLQNSGASAATQAKDAGYAYSVNSEQAAT